MNNRKKFNNNWSSINMNNNIGNYDSLLGKNCALKGHTIVRCFELIGYPLGFKKNHNLKPANCFNQNNNVGVNSETKNATSTLSFTNEQVLKLMNLMNDKTSSSLHANMVSSASCSFFNFNVFFNQNFYRFFVPT